MAHGAGRRRADADHRKPAEQLVPACITGRKTGGLHFLRPGAAGAARAPAEHAGGAVTDGCGRRKSAQGSVAVWRARFDQRELLGRRQHAVCICELRDFGRPEMTDEVNKNDF